MLSYLYITVLLSNLIIGILLGMTGISGFLLPLIYVAFLHLPLRNSLALSFLSFAVSGIIGAYSYWKSKNMDLKLAFFLSIGSLPGAFLGVQLNSSIPDEIVKLILYIFVLFSGISILVKEIRKKSNLGINKPKSKILESKILVIILGVITAAICSLTGAGGPILIVPVLVKLGIQLKISVGVSLLNSVIIALPSVLGYYANSTITNNIYFIISSLIGMIIGIITGSYFANKVKIVYLSVLISLLTILSSSYMLIRIFL